ncbi:glycerol-3-phosphate acyltransferase 2, mitochondrial isoform X4 [Scophthalmus maximus]|uniref:glycerol-3-phosphate acyltransferase 2, mitochondrial isoform X4 n=1 Tax=Scophthalmus maximus TaxID=52904 RepID=UPI0015E09912|nr:glycerol-3-phosphate acyltransferase 2, mitochondrial isoform X4 [Scophthalmus maximus]
MYCGLRCPWGCTQGLGRESTAALQKKCHLPAVLQGTIATAHSHHNHSLWVKVCRGLIMVQEKNDGINEDMVPSSIQQNTHALSWQLMIKKKLITVPSCLGKIRPVVGQCCQQCAPDSLRKKLGQNSFLGFRNLLSFNETQTRYRGWLVRRVCCALFVSGRKVYASPVSNRLERVCQSNRVKEGLTAEQKAPEGQDSRGQLNRFSPFLPLIKTCISPSLLRFVGWVMLKMFSSVFGGIQVNLNHLSVLRKVSQEESMLVYVYVRQSVMDCALIPLVLFGHNLRVPYTVCPLRVYSSPLRSILQKVGVFLLPPTALTEQEAEMDSLYSPVMTSLLRELLHEGQAISVGVSAESGQGGQWLARIRQLIKDGSVPDVSLVPVGISYDCVPKTNIQVGLIAVFQWLWSLFWRRPEGSVRIHFAQPFSLKEMCESGRCRVDEWLPLQDLLLPVILNNRPSVFRQRRMSWLLPSPHYASELEAPTHPERDLGIAIILHLIFSCAVSAMLCEVVASGISSSIGSDGVDGEEVRGDVEFDVVLCQSELTEHALHLCHLLPPGFMPPCQSSQSFALDAIDSLVRCGILIMEDIPREVPICDFLKREGTLTWTTSDDPDESDSDCEEPDLHAYKISQPSHCPEMLFFLCSMLAGHLRALCWTTIGLDLIDTPRPETEFVAQIHSHLCDTANKKKQHYESCSEEAAHTAVRTLIDLGVLSEERQREGVSLAVSPLFQLSENRQKLHRFITQYLYN